MKKLKATMSNTTASRKCTSEHARIPVGKGFLIGRGCADFKDDADVYIALDSTAIRGDNYPWEAAGSVKHVYFQIQNMKVPDIAAFKPMITWICNQLQIGKTVHVACMGGHGRTGLVLAAVLREAKGMRDAVTWLRKHYCDRAVESSAQIDFLAQHYDCDRVDPVYDSTYRDYDSYRNWEYGDQLDFMQNRTQSSVTASPWRPRLWADT